MRVEKASVPSEPTSRCAKFGCVCGRFTVLSAQVPRGGPAGISASMFSFLKSPSGGGSGAGGKKGGDKDMFSGKQGAGGADGAGGKGGEGGGVNPYCLVDNGLSGKIGAPGKYGGGPQQ